MNHFGKSLFASLIASIICINVSFSQALSPAAMKVKTAYVQLKIYPGSKPKQLAYLNAFPQNKQQFVEIFNAPNNGQLTSNSQGFIATFVDMAKNYPTEVIDKSVNIGKDLTHEADAIGQLQHAIVDLGNHYTKLFAKKVNSLSDKESDNLVKFLADAENHSGYTQYQQLTEELSKIGEVKLSNKFVQAKEQREKSNGH